MVKRHISRFSIGRIRNCGFSILAFVLLTLANQTVARAQSRAEFVMIGRLIAVVHRPDFGPAPHIAVIYENGEGSVAHGMCVELARRGFMTICSSERPAGDSWEDVALDIKADVEYARRQPGITKVILYGHSGGGAVLSFYQAVAENGVAFCQDPKKLSACSDKLAGLPPADGVMFPDAHPGLGVMDLRMLNPSITSDGVKLHINPGLDPYDPKNGFNPNGPSNYSPEFKERYFKAQAQVMEELITKAQKIRERVKGGEITDPAADRVAILGFSFTSRLPIECRTREPRRLLRNDGSIVTEVITSVATPGGAEPMPMMSPRLGVSAGTSAHFLSRMSVHARNSMTDVDYCSANNITVCNTRSINVPVLFIPAGAGDFLDGEELMFENSSAQDKEYIVVEGALHGGQPCKQCEKTPGQFSNSEKNMYDYMRDWINKRF
jgi:hypothetical protein